LLAKQQSELQLRIAQTTDKLNAELLPVLILYYPIFAAQHCTDATTIHAVMGQFAERMIIEGVTRKGFAYGVEALKKRAGASAFILNPQAFAELCKQAAIEALNIPNFPQVMAEVVGGKRALRFGEGYVFSHPLCRIICSRKGDLIYELTGIEFEKAIKSEYEHWVKRLQDGEQLPEPQLVIGHDQRPEMPVELRVVPKSAMALRAEAMRAEALARKGH
jgi:hypothetical protein